MENESQTQCPTPALNTKTLPDGSIAFYWQNPACGSFYARGTSHPDPENAPDESFEVIQPTVSSRFPTQSAVRIGMIVLGPVYRSVILPQDTPYTGVELFGPSGPVIPSK